MGDERFVGSIELSSVRNDNENFSSDSQVGSTDRKLLCFVLIVCPWLLSGFVLILRSNNNWERYGTHLF